MTATPKKTALTPREWAHHFNAVYKRQAESFGYSVMPLPDALLDSVFTELLASREPSGLAASGPDEAENQGASNPSNLSLELAKKIHKALAPLSNDEDHLDPITIAKWIDSRVALPSSPGVEEARIRLDELMNVPHYPECQTLLATGVEPYPPCNCWVGHRIAEVKLTAERQASGQGQRQASSPKEPG